MLKRFKEEIYPLIGRDFYRDKVVKDLYERRDTFDVFVIDQFFNEVSCMNYDYITIYNYCYKLYEL